MQLQENGRRRRKRRVKREEETRQFHYLTFYTQILDFVNTVGDVRHSYGKCLAENSPHKADVKS